MPRLIFRGIPAIVRPPNPHVNDTARMAAQLIVQREGQEPRQVAHVLAVLLGELCRMAVPHDGNPGEAIRTVAQEAESLWVAKGSKGRPPPAPAT